MKKIFNEILPRKYGIGANRNKLVIDWKNSIGYFVKGIYDDIKFEMQIIDYYQYKKKGYLKIKYKKNNYSIRTDAFINCNLQKILHDELFLYKYQVGDIITDVKSGKLQILEQIKIKSGRNMVRGYNYKCLICENKDKITEYQLNDHIGCNVCCNNPQKVLKGYNDMWITNPELAKLLANPEDGYKYTENSNQYVDWKCPICGNIIKNKMINQINRQRLSCPKCSDKLPYTEKFIYQFLKELEINFSYQLSKATLNWCKNYRYDFYFKINNEEYILEIHGIQHYQESFKHIIKSKTVEEEQENDKLKKELALQNDIKPENYIIIDCRKSTLEWIKNSIINSKLNELFDLSKIDWLECHVFACNSLVKEVCNLWNSGIKNVSKIEKNINLSNSTIRKYLKRGVKLGWCDYDPKEEHEKTLQKGRKIKCKKVICVNNKKIFNSIAEAAKETKTSSIWACCKRKCKSAGKDPTTGEKLRWMYYDD